MPDLSQMEVQERPCKTCPFAGEEPVQLSRERYAELVDNLLGNGQQFCHSADNQKICRGGRDIQLRWLCAMGYLEEPTDEMFNQKMQEIINGKG